MYSKVEVLIMGVWNYYREFVISVFNAIINKALNFRHLESIDYSKKRGCR